MVPTTATATLVICLVLQVNGSILPASVPDGLITGNPRSSKEVLLNKDVLNQLLQSIFPSATRVNVDTGEVIQVVKDEVEEDKNTQEQPKLITVGNLNLDLSQLKKLPSQEPRGEYYDNRGINETPHEVYTSQQRSASSHNSLIYQPQEQSSRQTYGSQPYNPQLRGNAPNRLNEQYQRMENNNVQSAPSVNQPQSLVEKPAEQTYRQPVHYEQYIQHRTKPLATQNINIRQTQNTPTHQEEPVQQQYQQASAQQYQQASVQQYQHPKSAAYNQQIHGQRQQMYYGHETASTAQEATNQQSEAQGRRLQVGEISFSPVS